jgi:hypothetical protein
MANATEALRREPRHGGGKSGRNRIGCLFQPHGRNADPPKSQTKSPDRATDKLRQFPTFRHHFNRINLKSSVNPE